jgi:membrane protein YdbS with pleckstrin-like domain
MSTKNTKITVKSQVVTVATQIYSLFVWLFILFGGMVAVGSFFISGLPLAQHISGVSVGLVSVAFGLGLARLLNRDIKQTAPVLWF